MLLAEIPCSGYSDRRNDNRDGFPMNAAEEVLEPGRRITQRIVLSVFIVLLTAIYTFQHFQPTEGRWDFETFYFVGKMVRAGDGPRLYDLSLQAAYQMRYIDPSRQVAVPDLAFFYPAATAVLCLPLAWLPLTLAYALWTALSLTLLVLSVRLLQSELPMPQGDRPLFVALLFFPVYACLLHGQLSILILFLYSAAFAWFKRGNPFAAGVALGLGTLKFQLMLGFFAVLLLRRCWKALAGAAVGALPVAVASAAVLGWRGALRYPLTVTRFATIPAAQQKMVSLYGFLMTATGQQPQTWLLLILSVAVALAAASFVRKDLEIAFSVAVIASVFVAYHAYLHELTLMLIPAAVIASRVERMSKLVLSFAIALSSFTALLFLTGIQVATAVLFLMILFGLWHVGSRVPNPALTEAVGDAGPISK